jgi:cytoplasmic iron level regulating protein YaaA (DUF328/UPF0246 family)
MSGKFFVLLPPSEGKALGGNITNDPTHHNAGWIPDSGMWGSALNGPRREIVAALSATGGGTASMLGVKGPHLDRAQAANMALIGAAALPAWQRYTGVVWDHLSPGSLTQSQRSRILVASGLGGIFAAEDPVPDYRLKMGASIPGVGPVAKFWRAHIGAEMARLTKGAVIVDLLAQEQRKALPTEIPPEVTMLEATLRTRAGALGGHAAKAAKGLLARHLVTLPSQVSTSDLETALTTWDHPDFSVEIGSR